MNVKIDINRTHFLIVYLFFDFNSYICFFTNISKNIEIEHEKRDRNKFQIYFIEIYYRYNNNYVIYHYSYIVFKHFFLNIEEVAINSYHLKIEDHEFRVYLIIFIIVYFDTQFEYQKKELKINFDDMIYSYIQLSSFYTKN